jgi:hypothetical protein
MFKDRGTRLSPDNSLGAENFGQFMYGRKTGSDFSKEMTRSVKVALDNWQGKRL